MKIITLVIPDTQDELVINKRITEAAGSLDIINIQSIRRHNDTLLLLSVQQIRSMGEVPSSIYQGGKGTSGEPMYQAPGATSVTPPLQQPKITTVYSTGISSEDLWVKNAIKLRDVNNLIQG